MVTTRSKVLAIVCAVLCMSASKPSFAESISYFEMEEHRSDNIRPFPKWTGMMRRYGDQKNVLPEGQCGKVRYYPCTLSQWQNFVKELRQKPLQEQLEAVNRWGNEHPYIEDQLNWGQEDFWETPNEFIDISGDCEDYAISKYYTLRAAGVPADAMRIIVLQDLNLGGVIHAVLGVYNDETLYILDNQSQEVMPATRIYHYRPIFGINELAWWAYYPLQP